MARQREQMLTPPWNTFTIMWAIWLVCDGRNDPTTLSSPAPKMWNVAPSRTSACNVRMEHVRNDDFRPFTQIQTFSVVDSGTCLFVLFCDKAHWPSVIILRASRCWLSRSISYNVISHNEHSTQQPLCYILSSKHTRCTRTTTHSAEYENSSANLI